MNPEHLANTAKAQLLDYLKRYNATVLAEEADKNGIWFTIRTAQDREHSILLRLFNLDKERSISILKIPTKVFATPNDIFIDREQPGRFSHLSMWEIKVFTKGIEALSAYALDTTVMV